MAKFIVREKATGEFWTCITAVDMEDANQHMVEIVRKLNKMGESLVYTIEVAPEAPTFQNPEWFEDFNNPASRHHY